MILQPCTSLHDVATFNIEVQRSNNAADYTAGAGEAMTPRRSRGRQPTPLPAETSPRRLKSTATSALAKQGNLTSLVAPITSAKTPIRTLRTVYVGVSTDAGRNARRSHLRPQGLHQPCRSAGATTARQHLPSARRGQLWLLYTVGQTTRIFFSRLL